MESQILSLPFKGGRDYLHGTDMYDAIVGAAVAMHPGAGAAFHRMAIHAFARRQCRLEVPAPGGGAAKPKGAIADFLFRLPAGDLRGWLAETDEPVTGRRPFDEDSIVDSCRVDRDEIRWGGGFRANRPIEVLVAMTKAMHYRALPPAGGRWIFTKLELERGFRDADGDDLRVALRHNFQNRLTRSEIGSGPGGVSTFSFKRRCL